MEAGGGARAAGRHPALFHVVPVPQRPAVCRAFHFPVHGGAGRACLAQPEAETGIGAGAMSLPSTAAPIETLRRCPVGRTDDVAKARVAPERDSAGGAIFVVGTGRCGSTL